MSDWALNELTRVAESAEAKEIVRHSWENNLKRHITVMRGLGVWRPTTEELRKFDNLLGEKYNLDHLDPN